MPSPGAEVVWGEAEVRFDDLTVREPLGEMAYYCIRSGAFRSRVLG